MNNKSAGMMGVMMLLMVGFSVCFMQGCNAKQKKFIADNFEKPKIDRHANGDLTSMGWPMKPDNTGAIGTICTNVADIQLRFYQIWHNEELRQISLLNARLDDLQAYLTNSSTSVLGLAQKRVEHAQDEVANYKKIAETAQYVATAQQKQFEEEMDKHHAFQAVSNMIWEVREHIADATPILPKK